MAGDRRVGAGVGVILVREGEMLFGKRNGDPKKADSELRAEGTWTLPGGKIEYGEDLEEAAKRETLEETGIIVRAARVVCVNTDRNQHAHFITVGLLAESFVGEPKVMEPDEITEWGWFSPESLPEPMFFAARNILDCYLGKRFNKC